MNEAVVNNCYFCGASIALFEVILSTCALMSVSRGIYVPGEINVTDNNIIEIHVFGTHLKFISGNEPALYGFTGAKTGST